MRCAAKSQHSTVSKPIWEARPRNRCRHSLVFLPDRRVALGLGQVLFQHRPVQCWVFRNRSITSFRAGDVDFRFTLDCVAKLGEFLPVCLAAHSAVRLFRPSIEGLQYQGPAAFGYAYAKPATGAGGGRNSSLASRRRFCTVAVSSTSSLTPLRPRSRRRSSLKMRFI
jgi:hypothetical protein